LTSQIEKLSKKSHNLDWKNGPPVHEVKYISIPSYHSYYLDNGIKAIEVSMGTQEVMRIELIFRGGRILENKKLASKFCFALMREGCSEYTSAQLAEEFDYYGCSFRTGSNLDYSYVSISFITKYMDELLPLFSKAVLEPNFLEMEFVKYQDLLSQKLQLDLSKNELLSYRIFTEVLYGKDHVYGYNTEEKFIREITNHDVKEYYDQAIGSDNCFFVVAGKVPQDFSSKLNRYFGQHKKQTKPCVYIDAIETISPSPVYIQTSNEHQCAIKLGRRTFSRHHDDYSAFFLTNTVLGGYFGSRLMSSVREDLGYTYNIYSMSDHMLYDGYFYIDTETDPSYLENTKAEIFTQLDLLQQEAMSEEELKMVKNYTLGNFLNLVDGPFNVANLLRSFELDNINEDDFRLFVNEIINLDQNSIMEMSRKYFKKEQLIEVVVGPQL
jgi:predicted Zn-dependent peptidase